MRITFALTVVAFAACQNQPSAPKPQKTAENADAVKDVPTPEATATATVGKAAPDFTLKNLAGESVSLSAYQGKKVVLEWFNPDCPYVKFSHSEGPLKDMAKDVRAKFADVAWLAINSGAPGLQGHGVERNKKAVEDFGIDYEVLVDESGSVGRSYAAKTTPHMYVIDEKGTLVYAGALDNAPLGKLKGDEARNFVRMALDALAAGNPVDPRETKPYGCSVKYGS